MIAWSTCFQLSQPGTYRRAVVTMLLAVGLAGLALVSWIVLLAQFALPWSLRRARARNRRANT